MNQPRISSVYAKADAGSYMLAVTWADGRYSLVDVSGLVATFKVLRPLVDQELFRKVRLGEHGWSVCWSDEIDLSSDTLFRLAQEQARGVLAAVGG